MDVNKIHLDLETQTLVNIEKPVFPGHDLWSVRPLDDSNLDLYNYRIRSEESLLELSEMGLILFGEGPKLLDILC